MLKKIAKDKVLIALIVINIINALACAIGGTLLKIKYITLFITFLILIFCKREKSLPIVFYLHCNSALYDDVSFTYLFNFSIMIVLIKEVIFYRSKLRKDTTILFIVIFLYNIALVLIKDILTFNMALSLISWGASYLLLILYACSKKTDFEKIYRYFFVGFIMSCICAAIIPFKIWGINIPTAYRFIGLLRDPNYYSVDALFLIFSAKKYSKEVDKNPILYMVIISFLGILSISKMFILLLFIGIALYILFNASKIRIKQYQLVLAIVLLLVTFILAFNSNFLEMIKSKYTYRTQTTSLFTSRDRIQYYYINYMLEKPIVLLFGDSINYSVLSDVGNYVGEFFSHMVAHNTYIDILISWGIICGMLYAIFIFKVVKTSYKTSQKKEINDYKVLTIIFLLSLLSLSYIQADVFALLILYIILLSKDENEVEIKNE